MNEQPLVSIILPTYNVEQYLEFCLESIDHQTYTNYEVLIIIDGAKDSSYDIAEKYSGNHPKFSVFWQENQGSGPARNNGLDRAKGDFIMFVDPDDWIEPDCLEKLLFAQQEANFDFTIAQKIECFFDANNHLLSKRKAQTYPFEYRDQKSCREHYLQLYDWGLLGAPTRKLYRLSIIRDNGIKFPDYRRSQDIVFNYRYYNYIHSIKSIDYNGYDYRMPLVNSTGKFRKEYYQTVAIIYSDIKVLHRNWGVSLNEEALATHLFTANMYAYFQMAVNSNADITESVNDAVVFEIVRKSRPKRYDQRLLKYLLQRKMKRRAVLFIKFLCVLKRIWFNKN